MPTSRGCAVFLGALSGINAIAALRGQPADDTTRIRATYTTLETFIPMRDGVGLFTAVYLPKDTTRSAPMLLVRTAAGVDPYGPDAFNGPSGPNRRFEDEGYIFAYQDVRGSHR